LKKKDVKKCEQKSGEQVHKSFNQKIDLRKRDQIEYNRIAKSTRSAEILLNKLNLFK